MIRVADHLQISRIDNDVVILDSRLGRYFGLNPVAARMLELLKEFGDRDQVLGALQSAYSVDPAVLSRDFDAFVAQGLERGWLSEV